MEAHELVPGDFMFGFPLWVCVMKDDPRSMMGGQLKEGRFICVFTDEDLAERFIISRGLQAQGQPAGIEDPESFAEFLGKLDRDGYSHIVFDDIGKDGETKSAYSIPSLLESIRNEDA